jgi:CRISPR-associated protein Csy2
MNTFIFLRNIRVENANCIAGFTWGFPAISQFLGFTHALSRNLPKDWDIELDGCAVVCHDFQTHTHRTSSWGDSIFSLTRNPLTKDGKTPSFIEEGRMHMRISLAISCTGLVKKDPQKEAVIRDLALVRRLAGGTIIDIEKIEIENPPEDLEQAESFERKCLNKLLPGSALVQRSKLLSEHVQEKCPNDPLQAWMDFSSLQFEAKPAEKEEEKAVWNQSPKPGSGWLVPITVGYRGISEVYEPGKVARSRDATTPFCFVEPVYTIGEWISPHRLNRLEKLMWKYKALPEKGLYLCENHFEQA